MIITLDDGKEINVDINPLTLKEWTEINPDIIEGITKALTESRRSTGSIPTGYHRPEGEYTAYPIPEHISLILSVLDRHRFQQVLTIRQGLQVLRDQGVSIGTHQTLVNVLDRFEQILGLLPELPKSVMGKVKGDVQLRKVARERREAARDMKAQREARQKKKKLEQEINKRQKKIVKEAKDSMITAKELEKMRDNGLQETITKAKSSAKDLKYDDKLVDDDRILFKPTAKQAEFLAAPEKIVLYGGAAGGISNRNNSDLAPLLREK